ncbi:hypothetical protein Sru01_09070 [Sphaerisporangium rufum]|uniref:Major facilitator superfamily (MFS) profile domain-containing protein n=2 Tax=Sphaerisporangium rufum TaxID=1381558 RepID=A0A919R012_9ACTN|nr:hypothetical protein Sru01_09070 [Sphaerisporangium rufum]
MTLTRRPLFGGLPRVFWVLFGGQLVNRFGAMVLPFLATTLVARGFSAAQIGLVMSACGLGRLAGQPVGGLLADRVGRRATLIGGLVATSACLVALGAARGLPALAVTAGALGAAGGIYHPAAAALVADTVPAEARPRAFGMLHWAFNIGAALSGVAAGLLLAHGYWLLVAVDAAANLAFAVIVAAGVRPDRPVARDRRRPAGYRRALRDRVVVAVLALSLLGKLVYEQQRFGLPLAMAADGLPGSAYGLLITLNAGLIVLVQPVLVAWTSRFPRLAMLGVSWVLIGAGFALSGPAAAAWQYALAAVVWTAGEIGMAGFGAALVADLTPEGAHGTYQALYGWTGALAALVAPSAGAALYDGGALWWACAVAGALGGLSAVLLAPAVRRR